MKIKTREPRKAGIKTVERIPHLPRAVKVAHAGTRDSMTGENGAEDGSAAGYASRQVTGAAQIIIKEGGRKLYRGEKRAVQDTKENLSKT